MEMIYHSRVETSHVYLAELLKAASRYRKRHGRDALRETVRRVAAVDDAAACPPAKRAPLLTALTNSDDACA